MRNRIQTYVEKDIFERLQSLAAQEKCSVSSLVCAIVLKHLGEVPIGEVPVATKIEEIEDLIEKYIEDQALTRVSAYRLLTDTRCLGITPDRVDTRLQNRVTAALTKLGYRRVAPCKETEFDGKRRRLWEKIDLPQTHPSDTANTGNNSSAVLNTRYISGRDLLLDYEVKCKLLEMGVSLSPVEDNGEKYQNSDLYKDSHEGVLKNLHGVVLVDDEGEILKFWSGRKFFEDPKKLKIYKRPVPAGILDKVDFKAKGYGRARTIDLWRMIKLMGYPYLFNRYDTEVVAQEWSKAIIYQPDS